MNDMHTNNAVEEQNNKKEKNDEVRGPSHSGSECDLLA
jgi:hypothetical protein